MSVSDDDMSTTSGAEIASKSYDIAAAFDTLPRLTRVVFMLHRFDALEYDQIGWRCGMTIDEVTIRVADALTGLRRHQDRQNPVGRLRQLLVLWRIAWWRYRHARRDRMLGINPWEPR